MWPVQPPCAARAGWRGLGVTFPPCRAGTKETAFLSAVTAAGLVHSVTRSCSAGNVTECSCDVTLRHGGSPTEGWHWGGCSDDIHYGMAFSRRFLDVPVKNLTGKSGSGLVAMNLHNNEAGRQVGVTVGCGSSRTDKMASAKGGGSLAAGIHGASGKNSSNITKETYINSESELLLTR